MIKVFISQPMRDKTDGQIKSERSRAVERIKEMYPNDEIEVIDSFFEKAPVSARPLWFLGKSIEFLSLADVAYFCDGWDNYRGCKIEYRCALDYGIEVIIPHNSGCKE